MGYQPFLLPPGREGGLETEFDHMANDLNQPYLHNETPPKALDPGAWRSFLAGGGGYHLLMRLVLKLVLLICIF